MKLTYVNNKAVTSLSSVPSLMLQGPGTVPRRLSLFKDCWISEPSRLNAPCAQRLAPTTVVSATQNEMSVLRSKGYFLRLVHIWYDEVDYPPETERLAAFLIGLE